MKTMSNIEIQKNPIWNELKILSKDEKLKLIALLSSSMLPDTSMESKNDRTQEMIDRFCGSWAGDESAEEIIANIEMSRQS